MCSWLYSFTAKISSDNNDKQKWEVVAASLPHTHHTLPHAHTTRTYRGLLQSVVQLRLREKAQKLLPLMSS